MGVKSLRFFLLAVAILAPLILLFPPTAAFYGDWDLNLWLIGYQGEGLRTHGHFPAVYNIEAAVGLPVPVFYGYLLYPALGLFSSVLGANLALRLGVLLLVCGEAWALTCAARNAFRDRRLVGVTVIAVLWAAYPLTNLYNRSAVAEYFASGFFVSALAFAVAATGDPGSAGRRRHAWLAGISGVLAIGCHPPTAVLAVPCLAVLGGIALFVRIRRPRPAEGAELVHLLTPWVLGGVLLAPWIYANLRWSRKLAVVSGNTRLAFYHDRCDSLLGRFSPIPYDRMAVQHGKAGLSTPYLEAPVIAALLVLLVLNLVLGFRLRKEPLAPARSLWEEMAGPVLAAALAGFVLFTALSLSESLASGIRFLAPYIQFAYRLVAFSNAALLVAVLASGAVVAGRGGYGRFPRATMGFVLLALACATLGLGVKLQHAAAIRWWNAAPEFSKRGSKFPLVTEEYGRFSHDYSTPTRYRELTNADLANGIRLSPPVYGSGAAFSDVATVSIAVPVEKWAVTSVVDFPWNDLRLNGRRVPAGELARKGNYLAVRLPAGRSTLQWVWRPDPYWAALRSVSLFAAIVLFLGTLAGARPKAFCPVAERASVSCPLLGVPRNACASIL